jgi:hypothetical protein
MIHTLYYNNKRQRINTVTGAQYKLIIVRNPREYPNDYKGVSAREWSHIGSKIRSSNPRLCRGAVSTGFFRDDTVENTSVIFLLYYISPLGSQRSKRTSSVLIGFSLTNDLRNEREDTDIETDTLYIDVVCVNSNTVRHPPLGGIRGAGIFLMTQIEAYAKMQLGGTMNRVDKPFKILKLSALPYVISFYRYLGFRHIRDCGDLRRDTREGQHGKWTEKNNDIRTAALQSNTLRFKTDVELEYAMRIELAKHKDFLAKGKHATREKAEYFRKNLNQYFTQNQITFIFANHINTPSPGIVAIGPDSDTVNEGVTELIRTDNSAMYRLLNELRRNKLSVELEDEDTPAQGIRHMQVKDSDGDIAFHSLDEGFTMRKCLDMPPLSHSKSKSQSKSKPQSKSNSQSKSKSHSKSKPQSKSKSQSGGNKKWSGWANQAPRRGTQRNKMQKQCGSKCFLGPYKSFPICAKNTCKINTKGIWSAYIRARQQESAARNKTQKRRYAQISNKSRKMLLK